MLPSEHKSKLSAQGLTDFKLGDSADLSDTAASWSWPEGLDKLVPSMRSTDTLIAGYTQLGLEQLGLEQLG